MVGQMQATARPPKVGQIPAETRSDSRSDRTSVMRLERESDRTSVIDGARQLLDYCYVPSLGPIGHIRLLQSAEFRAYIGSKV